MFGIDDAVVGSLAGSVLSSGLSFLGGSSANKDAKKAAAAQIAFQRESLMNRHQWEVQDLRKAGLNPILSANSGAPGASGASYTPQNALASSAETVGKGAERAALLANTKADTVQKLANAGLAETNAKASAQNMNLKSPLENLANTVTPWVKGVGDAARRNVSDAREILQHGLPQGNSARSSIFDAEKNPWLSKIFSTPAFKGK